MKDFIIFLVQNIVDKADKVILEEREENGLMNYLLTVDPTDMGKIIGKEGRIIRAVRDLIRVAALKKNLRVNLVLTEQQ